MKKLIAMILSLLIVIMLGSCFETEEPDIDPEVPPIAGNDDEFIWNVGSEIYVVGGVEEFDDEQYSEKYGLFVMNVYNTLGLSSSASVKLSNDTGEMREHEIVIGRADRDISREAYNLLEAEADTAPKNDTYLSYLVYSDGKSLAIAFDHHEENAALSAVEEFVCENLFNQSTLKLSAGIVEVGNISMNELHQKRDDELVKQQWIKLEELIVKSMSSNIGKEKAESYAEDMIYELKNLYSMYTDDLVAWFANLYEPYICICDGECQKTRYCGGAGFYYSNSARDNKYVERDGEQFLLLPDAETTAQVIGGFIRHSGILDFVNGDYFSAFPEGEPERIVRFIKALQDEKTGYFYHPQWLSMLGTPSFWDSRQSRDMTYSVSVLSAFGAKPTYNTPSGTEGDGILYDGTNINTPKSLSNVTLPLQLSGVSAVSRVVATGSVHPNLVSEDAFRKYLAGYDSSIGGNSYYIGNELGSLAYQVVARDKAVGTPDNPKPYATILANWLESHQDPNTGHWHKQPTTDDYYPTNGLLKIAVLYNTIEMEFPNPLPAARCAFKAITSEQPINHVCDLYNTWFIISQITQNLKKYAGDEELAKLIIDEVRVDAIPAVKVTAEKMITHRKADGSFSYYKNNSSFTSQNAPVAIYGTNEGDVNATVIFTYGILGYMFDALDFGGKIQMFTDRDREVFVDILEERIENCEKRKNDN